MNFTKLGLLVAVVASFGVTSPTFAGSVLPNVTPSCEKQPEGCRTLVVTKKGTLRQGLAGVYSLEKVIVKNGLDPETAGDMFLPQGTFVVRL